MTLPLKMEFPQPGTDVVFKIAALWPQAGAVSLEQATQIQLPPVWVTRKQRLCLSLTTDGRIQTEVLESDAIDWSREVIGIPDGLGARAIRVREGGGPENLAMSLAVTVADELL